jgi:hypothetical protein
MRTARSPTSGEKRFDFLLMVPSSQSVEPPQNPGRFIAETASVNNSEHLVKPDKRYSKAMDNFETGHVAANRLLRLELSPTDRNPEVSDRVIAECQIVSAERTTWQFVGLDLA